MNFLSRARQAWSVLSGDASVTNSLELFREIYGGRPASSGMTVNLDTALQVSTVFACLRVIADGVAQAPLKLYKARPGGGADPATDHPLYNVLYRKPNPWQTSFAFRETLIFHLALCGNFYAFITRVRGQIDELIPIEPNRVTVKQNEDFSLIYTVRGNNGQTREIPASNIWHIRGPSWNSWAGLEIVKIAREAVGLTMAIERDQAHLYKNGVRTTGTYSVEGKLDKTQYEDLRKFIKTHAAGDSGDPMIMDRGAKWLQQTMSSIDAQMLESRRMQVEEVCREFRVMPIMVGHSDKSATYASAEQMFIAHKVHCLAPMYERIEQSIDNDLLDGPGDKDIYAKFNDQALIRGSMIDQANMFAKALGSGGSPAWMTQDEVRELLELNPMGGDAAVLPKPTSPAAPDAPSSGSEPAKPKD